MKGNIKNAFLLLPLITCLGLILPGRATAQTFTTLHSFNGSISDGSDPQAGLIFAGNSNTLYGTSYKGGSTSGGTVFAINTDGTGFTILHNFLGDATDGAWPQAELILSGNTLYGTASVAGSGDNGTVFAVNT